MHYDSAKIHHFTSFSSNSCVISPIFNCPFRSNEYFCGRKRKLKIASYGYWAALKRLGKAQEVTGCDDHELLMPFSVREISSNPKLRQNPGY